MSKAISREAKSPLTRQALLLGTALGCSIAVVALGAPNAAWAANECGPVVNSAGTDTATCVAGTYPNGISYTEGGTNNLVVILDSGVTSNATSGPGERGVNAIGAANYDVSVTTASGDVITSNYNGVYALTSGTGNASMVNGADVTAYGRGLLADAIGAGNMSLVNTGNVTVKDALYGTYAVGILGVAEGGNGYVNNSGTVSVTDTVGGSAYGILNAVSGNLTEFNSGAITVTSNGNAYGISSTAGFTPDNVYINNSAPISVTSTGAGNAIGVDQGGTGSVTIIQTGNVTASAQSGEAAGMITYSSGDLAVTAGNVSAISATGYALGVSGNATGNVSVTGAGSIYASGNTAIGVHAYSETGTVTVNVGNVTSYSTAGTQFASVGILAVGSGDVSVTAGNVVTSGTLAYGITAHSTSGDTSMTVQSVTTSGDEGFGIYETALAGNVSLSAGSITTTGFDAGGVFARGEYSVALNINNVSTAGDDSRAIYAGSSDGNTSVVSGDVTTAGNFSGGIEAYGRYGASVVAVSTVTSGYEATAIEAFSDYGNASVTSSYVRTSGNYSGGIEVYGNHSAYVHNTGYVETSGTDSTGIDASSDYGPTTVVSHTVITTGYGSDGIDAYAYSGNVSVTSDNVITHGKYAYGIDAAAYTGNVTVNSGNVITYGDYAPAVTATTYNGNVYVTSGMAVTHGNYSPGIQAFSYGAGNVTVNSGTVVTYGAYSTGIDAENYAGNISVTSNYVATHGYESPGIFAFVHGAGNVSVNSGTVRTYGDYSPGIVALSYGGNVSVTSGLVVTHGYESDGIVAEAFAGDITIHSGTVVTYGNDSPAIYAITGAGNISVTTTGDTYTYGLGSDAIYAHSLSAGNVTVNTGGHTYSYDGVGVHVISPGYATINNHGRIYGYRGGIVSYSADGTTINNNLGGKIYGGNGYAIGVSGGAAVINNAGAIYGYAILTANSDTVNNTGVWNAYGTTEFGAGTDTFNNLPGGTVHVAPFSSAATTVTWNGLEAFNNQGLVDLRNGHAGDIFVLNADTGGTTWTGSNNSTLAIDATLNASLSADELVIGAALGSTNVIVQDVSSGPPALNFVGVPVVQATSGAAGAFTMAPLHDGFVDYELSFNSATTTWNLVGLPGQPAFEFLKVPAMAEGFWRRTGDAWSAREQEIRDSMWGSDPGTRAEGWEMWSQAQIGGERLGTNNETFTIQGFTFTPNLRTDTDWRGFQMGADTLHGNMLWGFTGGFLEQNTIFHFDRNSLDMTGWNFGAYAGWTSGHFFLNGLIKGDWYDLKSNMPTVPAYETFNGNTWGVKGEAGFRFGGHSFYMEPVADVAWTSTHLDDANFHGLGADFAFSNNTVARGSIGARVGGQWGSILPYVGLYAVDEWDDNAKLTMMTGGGCPGSCFSIEDTHPGSYGKVDFGFTTTSWNGLEGFLKGEDEFGSHIDGFIGRLGVRWRW